MNALKTVAHSETQLFQGMLRQTAFLMEIFFTDYFKMKSLKDPLKKLFLAIISDIYC